MQAELTRPLTFHQGGGRWAVVPAGERVRLLPWTAHEQDLRKREPGRLVGFLPAELLGARRWLPVDALRGLAHDAAEAIRVEVLRGLGFAARSS